VDKDLISPYSHVLRYIIESNASISAWGESYAQEQNSHVEIYEEASDHDRALIYGGASGQGLTLGYSDGAAYGESSTQDNSFYYDTSPGTRTTFRSGPETDFPYVFNAEFENQEENDEKCTCGRGCTKGTGCR